MQTGVSGETDCSQPSGCIVSETRPNSFNAGFATAGGGVWAAQFDVAGILCVFHPVYILFDSHGRHSIWFWTVRTVFKFMEKRDAELT
jgi:hypothetical protein